MSLSELYSFFPCSNSSVEFIAGQSTGKHSSTTLSVTAAFFTVAAKEGSSENLHLDWNDHPRSVAWVVPIWDDVWEGGDLYVPQVNVRVPSGSGDAIAFSSRHLAHAGTEITEGNRLVLTLFADRTLMKRGLEATQNN